MLLFEKEIIIAAKLFDFYSEKKLLQITKKPDGINDNEAAGVLYAGLTAWSALYIFGRIGGCKGATTSNGLLCAILY